MGARLSAGSEPCCPIHGSTDDLGLGGDAAENSNFEGGVRVPAIVAGGLLPVGRRGQEYAGIFAVCDWLPTILTAINGACACGVARVGSTLCVTGGGRRDVRGRWRCHLRPRGFRVGYDPLRRRQPLGRDLIGGEGGAGTASQARARLGPLPRRLLHKRHWLQPLRCQSLSRGDHPREHACSNHTTCCCFPALAPTLVLWCRFRARARGDSTDSTD
jgi:hypothetical protein